MGSIGLHVNPHGIVHDTVTLRDVSYGCFVLIGPRVSEDSWFPGYDWQVADCGVCGQHIGWHFTLCSHSSGGHEMIQNFWGLRRAAMMDERHRSTFGFLSMEYPLLLHEPRVSRSNLGSALDDMLF